MAKYYIQCAGKRIILQASDPREAAMRAIERWWSFGYELVLGKGVTVCEAGFGHDDDAHRYATYELVAELEGRPVDDLVESVLAGIRGA
jgi:hypothetical protein